MTSTNKLIDYIDSIHYDNLDKNVVNATKKSILDTIGVLVAGSKKSGCLELAQLTKDWAGKPQSTVFVHGFMVPCHHAALVNSTMARALDFDDVHVITGAHPSATIVPLCLAVSEMVGRISGAEFIAAVALGNEITCRLRLVPEYCLAISGWVSEVHSTFGGAASAAKLLKLPKDQISNALGLAYSQAAGNIQGFYDGSSATRLQQGLASHAGILSALLANMGLTGAKDFLDGPAGFYPVYYRGIPYDMNKLVDNLGKRYELLNLSIKPYPCCGFTHAPIENILHMMSANNINYSQINKIVFKVNKRMYTNVCTPESTRYRPTNIIDAMFSLPYVIGTAILKQDVLISDFCERAISDSSVLEAVDKIQIHKDSEIEAESLRLKLPLSLHAAEMLLNDGRTFSRKLKTCKGFPEKPMSFNDCAEKFRKCFETADIAIKQDYIDNIVEIVYELDNISEINNSLIQILKSITLN